MLRIRVLGVLGAVFLAACLDVYINDLMIAFARAFDVIVKG